MARKAQLFRYEQERKHTKKKPAAAPASKSQRKAPVDATRTHTARKASYVLEESDGGKPSRKSSRKAANHQKTDSSLKAKVTLAAISPSARTRHR